MKINSSYSIAEKESIIWALSITIIISVAFSYVTIDIWWGKLIFEIASKLFLFLFSWKIISAFILSIKVKNWERHNKDYLIRGKWYVLHFSDNIKSQNMNAIIKDAVKLGATQSEDELNEIIKARKSYLRIGTVRLQQKMDEIMLIDGANCTPNPDIDIENTPFDCLCKNCKDCDNLKDCSALDMSDSGSEWRSTSPYRFTPGSKEFSGAFNVIQSQHPNDADGLHILTIKNSGLITGRFYNANSVDPKKPSEGVIMLIKSSKAAQNKLVELMKAQKSALEVKSESV